MNREEWLNRRIQWFEEYKTRVGLGEYSPDAKILIDICHFNAEVCQHMMDISRPAHKAKPKISPVVYDAEEDAD